MFIVPCASLSIIKQSDWGTNVEVCGCKLKPLGTLLQSGDLLEYNPIDDGCYQIPSAEQLYDRYAACLLSVIMKIIPDQQTAENTLVKVFVHVSESLPLFMSKKDVLLVWMMNNARNFAIDELCEMQKDRVVDDNLQSLPIAEKTVFALYHFRSYSVAEISGVLHVSYFLVEKLLRSAEAKVTHHNKD